MRNKMTIHTIECKTCKGHDVCVTCLDSVVEKLHKEWLSYAGLGMYNEAEMIAHCIRIIKNDNSLYGGKRK
jgi:hypothetical protein